MREDARWMSLALEEARKAQGEVPVGALLIFEGEVIAADHNRMEERQEAMAHAEMLALQSGARALGRWRLHGTTLYTTLEPCAMCAGAILLSRIDRLVWGAPDHRHGAAGSWVNLFREDHPTHRLEIVGGILAEESAALMQRFFRMRRNQSRGKG
ncbi:MAG: tRNA adenosine(34) deaminase TadA [Chlamydiota bacterium]|nr:tRNA adenosine(34) deaminase TadA [Chlamydiota bacterium]